MPNFLPVSHPRPLAPTATDPSAPPDGYGRLGLTLRPRNDDHSSRKFSGITARPRSSRGALEVTTTVKRERCSNVVFGEETASIQNSVNLTFEQERTSDPPQHDAVDLDCGDERTDTHTGARVRLFARTSSSVLHRTTHAPAPPANPESPRVPQLCVFAELPVVGEFERSSTLATEHRVSKNAAVKAIALWRHGTSHLALASHDRRKPRSPRTPRRGNSGATTPSWLRRPRSTAPSEPNNLAHPVEGASEFSPPAATAHRLNPAGTSITRSRLAEPLDSD